MSPLLASGAPGSTLARDLGRPISQEPGGVQVPAFPSVVGTSDMSTDSRAETTAPWTQLLGFAALEIAFLMSVGTVVARSAEHRNWWIAAAVVTQLVLVGAVVGAFRRRRKHQSRGSQE